MERRWLFYPYQLWMLMFTVVPLALIFFFAFADTSTYTFTLDNIRRAAEPVYLRVLWRSVWLAAVSTLVCFLIGYPMAMILVTSRVKYRNMMVVLTIIPMWMNFLLRTYAWMTLLEKNGLFNAVVKLLGAGPVQFLYTDGAVLLGMVYNFLPFMILPIYSVLMKMDKSLVEAAQDLGADAFTTFRRVTFPLSLPGVYAGMLMVFMPAVTTFVISRLLGGGQFMLIGNVIEQQFLAIGNWGFGSALSVLMMVLIMISMMFLSRYNKTGGGMYL
ncbi:MAG: ABC transporter permease [Schwartzia sp.]|nr:ABC transporter permease [Schwartzia sp. (in: firmicutes)]